MKTILFLPSQVGMAHYLRCGAVAEVLARDYDFRVYLLVEASKLPQLPPLEGVTCVTFTAPQLAAVESIGMFLQKRFSREDVRSYVALYEEQVDQLKPDHVVIDTDLFGLVAALAKDAPCTMIINALNVPYRQGLLGEQPDPHLVKRALKNASGRFTNRFLRSIIDDLLKKRGLPYRANQILEHIPLILPEWKGYVRLWKYPDNFHFVGPLLSPILEQRNEQFEQAILKYAHGRPIIYVTFGGTGYSEQKFWAIINTLLSRGYYVVSSTGLVAKQPQRLSRSQAYITQYVPGLSASWVANGIISHGSLGTVTHAILTGKPLVALPFNLDQLLHAYKLEELGIGRNMCKIGKFEMIRRVYNWAWIQQRAEGVSPVTIVDALEDLLRDPHVASQLARVHNKFSSGSGVLTAARLIADAVGKSTKSQD